MQAYAHRHHLVHRIDVERSSHRGHAMPQSRIWGGRAVTHPVHIQSFQCGESGIEAIWCQADAAYRYIVRKGMSHPQFQGGYGLRVQMPYRSGQHIVIDVQMAGLITGMHSGIGTPSHNQMEPWRLNHMQDPVEAILHHALHRTQPWLTGPPVEIGAVVGAIYS